MSRAASSSGRSILIFTSKRPGRRIAGSIMSSRFDAPMTITFFRVSTPSISERSCGTIVFSTSEEIPLPRVRNSESISSKKTMTGNPSADRSFARWKMIRICRSVSPTYLFKSSGPLMLRKYECAVFCPVFSATCWASEFATAFAISVLPQPGGPYSSTPLGGSSWCSAKSSEYRNGSSTASRMSSICGPRPPMSSYVMSGISSRMASSTSSRGSRSSA